MSGLDIQSRTKLLVYSCKFHTSIWYLESIGMADKQHQTYTLPQRMFQWKRLPLYVVVAGTFGSKSARSHPPDGLTYYSLWHAALIVLPTVTRKRVR